MSSNAIADGTVPIKNRLTEMRGGRTLQEVASAVGLTRGGLHLLEAGKIFPKESTLKKLCSYYGCDVGNLYSVHDFQPNNSPEK